MTSVIAHEINNPLESITNLLYLLRSELPEMGPAMNYITMAEGELHRISGITKQTLRWTRETTGTVEEFWVSAVIDEVLKLFAGKTRNRELKVLVKGEPDVAMTGVVGQVRQVMANLMSNAIDAAPVGGEVWIETLRTATQTGFRIGDNGPGIQADRFGRLFEPFYSTKGDLGNGLGLYISKEIAERHGGVIEVDTSASMGTTVTVLLPFGPQVF